jgi:PAS domain S-box-containing protein
MSQTGANWRHSDAEEASGAIEKRLRLIIDTIPTIVWSKLPDGSADFLNRNFREYTGLSLEHGLGWGWMDAFHPDDRLMEEWRAALAAEKPFEKEARLRRADGQYRWFVIRAMPMRDERGNLDKWYGVSVDVHDRKRAESHSRILLDAIPQQIWSGPPDGTLDYCNERWRSYIGIGLDELQGDGWQRMLHPDDRERVLRAWQKSVTTGTPYEQEERHLGVDGTYRWFLARGLALRDAEGRIVRWYGTNTDVEDRKQAEEELRRLSGQLLRLQDEERRRIARDLHDSTGQELVALATTLSQLHASIPSSSRKLRKLASQSIALADQCIRDIRTLSYLLHPPMLDEAGLEDAIRHYVGGFTERTGIEVELDISPRLGRMKPHVELALFRIVQESLTNIQRHSGSTQAKLGIECDPGKIRLEISDKGRGIPGTPRRRNAEMSYGAGVGIPSMHERVALIGGQFDIESSSSGTTVRVTIPADD